MSWIRRMVLPLCLAGAFAAGARGQESAPAPADVAARKRIGFYFGLGLTKLSQQGQANGLGIEVARPPLPGIPPVIQGNQLDGDFASRLDLEFMVGFRLRDAGNVEVRFFQWDEKKDLLRVAGDGKAIANSLASPRAGYLEDVDGLNGIAGFSGGLATELDGTQDSAWDAAEDVNFNGAADFIRFATSDRLVGQMETDYQTLDFDYRRTWKKLRRFTLDWRAGARIASLDQKMDLAYREIGTFAVFIDDEADRPSSTRCPPRTSASYQDGDGDGADGASRENDGDGFMDGQCDDDFKDRLDSVETVSEDRIVADIATSGYGLKFGVDGRFDLSKKWRLAGSIAVSVMKTDVEFRYRETFTSERDRFLNFIDWDFNGDGEYNNLDLDFDGSCNGVLEGCIPNSNDDAAVTAMGGVDIRTRTGVERSVISNRYPGQPNPQGVNQSAYFPPGANLMVGDPVGEAERNNEIVRETTLLNDLAGESSSITPILDIHVGLEYQFSRLAHLGFGIRASRWFDAGRFRPLANDVVAGRDPVADGDFTMSGAYVTLTIIPR